MSSIAGAIAEIPAGQEYRRCGARPLWSCSHRRADPLRGRRRRPI